MDKDLTINLELLLLIMDKMVGFTIIIFKMDGTTALDNHVVNEIIMHEKAIIINIYGIHAT